MVQLDNRKLSLVSHPIQWVNRTLSGCLERTASSSRSLRQLLKLHEGKLKNCHDPYSPRSPKSRETIHGGKVTLIDGQVVTLSDQRKKNVLELSDMFEMNELDALDVWLQFLHARQSTSAPTDATPQSSTTRVTDLNFEETKLDEESITQFALFYFEERRSALIVVASTLHIVENESSPINGICSEFLDSIISVDTPSSMLQSFAKRTRVTLPDSVRATARQASVWTQQLMLEQKLILEVVFLLFYGRIRADGVHYHSTLAVLKETSWGKSQACLAHFDEQTSAINLNVCNLLTLIALQVSHIEDICSPEYSLTPEPTERELTNPTKLKEIYDLQLNLLEQHPLHAAPVALAWSFILHKLTIIYGESGIPEEHQEFATLILPQMDQTVPNQDDDANAELPEENMPLYQRWARHILSHQFELFQNLSQLVISVYSASSRNRFGAPDNNALGYLVTVRLLLSAIPVFFKLSYLSNQQFEELLNVFGLLFRLDVQHAIAADLWREVLGEFDNMCDNDLSLASGEAEYLTAARVRFPVNLGLFTKLCRSLSGFNETKQVSESNEQLTCLQSLLAYADHIPTLTEPISSSQSPLLPLCFEPTLPPRDADSPDGAPPGTQGWVKATRPIWISPDIQIPKHTVGKIVSGIDQKPILVCWRFTWSAWQYWGRLLLLYAGHSTQQSHHENHADIFGSSSAYNSSWAEEKLETDIIVDILKILTSAAECNTELGTELISKMVGNVSHQGLIQALFNLIENPIDMATHALSSEITQISLRLVSALSPIFPGAVWTLVRGSRLLFPDLSKASTWNAVDVSVSTLKFERLSGEYGVTLAILDLAQMLLMEAISSGLTTNQTFAVIKAEVLVKALDWICEEVWPGFQNWKYRRLDDKFKITSKCCTLFNTIASEALKTQLLSRDIKTDLVLSRVTQSFFSWFLTSATTITLNPLISIMTTDKNVMEVLRKFHRSVELEAFVESLLCCVRLAKNILALKINHLPSAQPSLLERLFMAPSSRKSSSTASAKDLSRPSVLPFVAQWCLDAPHLDIARDACDIISFLCFLSHDWPSDWPSISSGFGDPDDMSRFLHELALQGAHTDDDDGLSKSSFWNLLAVLLDTQPSLAAIIVTGRTSLPGSTSSSSDWTLPSKSPFELGISTFVKCFENNNQLNITVGLSVLYFLYSVYSQANGFTSALSKTLDNQEFVDRIVDISTSLIITPQPLLNTAESRLLPMSHSAEDVVFGDLEELQVKYFCSELMCKAYATRTLTVLLQLESDLSTNSQAKRNISESVSKDLQKTPTRLSELISSAIESLADPELQSEALQEINNRYPNFDLDTYRRVDPALPYEKLELYGKGFVYDYELLKGRIRGSEVSVQVADEVMKNLIAINWNLSAVDAQLEVTQSWETFLEVVSQQKKLMAPLGNQLSQSVLASAKIIAEESRGGDFMVNIHSARIAILLIVLQALPVNEETVSTTIKLLDSVKTLISSERFPILDSIKRRLKINWHTNFLKLLYLIFKRCAPIKISSLNDEQRHAMINLADTFLRSSISILETVLTLALVTSDTNYEQDLDLSVSIFNQLMNSPVRPPIMNWAHRIHDLCQPAFNLLTQELIPDEQEPIFAEHIIRLFMSLALDDRLAEYMASEGLIPVLLNISLTQRASQGLIEPVSSNRPVERTPIHRLWCSILALVTSLANTLCHSEIFMLDEIGSFARLYSPQLLKAVNAISTPDHISRGAYDMSLTIAGIEEAELVTDLLAVISSKPIGRPLLTLPESYCLAMLTSLQTLAHCLNHPNSTSKWLENDATWKTGGRMMSQSLNRSGKNDEMVVDNGQNLVPPVQEALLHMLQTSRNILQTLISHTRALKVLTQDVAEWATEYASINPTRSIVVGDTATIGTLFELAEISLDIYRLACTRQSGSNTTPAKLSDPPCLSVGAASAAVLESSLLLASTQLALWLYSNVNSENSLATSHKHISSNTIHKEAGEMGGQSQASSSSSRLRREILTDLAPDLKSSIDKAISTVKLINSRTTTVGGGMLAGSLNRSTSNKKNNTPPSNKPLSFNINVVVAQPSSSPHSLSSSSFKKNSSLRDSSSGNLNQNYLLVDLLCVLKSFNERYFIE